MINFECPSCRRRTDFMAYFLCTFLGPPLLLCPCGQVIKTSRRELRQMPPFAIFWFILWSFIYALGVGIMGGLSLLVAPQFWGYESTLDFGDAFLLCSGLVLLLQIYRAICSLRRREGVPVPASFWNLQTALQLKVILIIAMLSLGSWAISALFGLQ